MGQAAKIVEDLGFDYVDINMGCTVKKVTSRGEGAALLNNEHLAYEIVQKVTQAVQLPVTVKLRIGPSKKKITVASLSQKLVDAGAIALTIHGRTSEKKFASPLDLPTIRNVVQQVSIPIIANGGIYSGQEAKEALFQTGAAAIMPGRGLIGNPWLIPEIASMLSGKTFSSPSLKEKKLTCLKHTNLMCDHYGERRGVIHMRKILPKYFSTTHHLIELKRDIQSATTKNDIVMILKKIEIYNSQWHYMSTS